MSALKVIELADGRHCAAYRVLRLEAATQFLTHSEDEEQPVVGSGAEHEHDQDELRDRGNLHTEMRCSGDDRAREREHQRSGQERHQRREQRAKRDEQQHDDEEQRELLDIALRALRLTLLVDEPGIVPVRWNWRPDASLGKRRADCGDERDRVAAGAERREVGDDLRLLRVLVGREPEVLDAKNPGERADPRLDAADLLDVRGGEHAVLASRDQRRDAVLRVLEGLREILGLHRW